MKIGEVDVPTSVPQDLDARLRSSVGVSALEAVRILSGGTPIPGLLARMIEPLVKDGGPSRGEITALIAKAGTAAVRVDLAELIRAAVGIEAPASPPPPSGGQEPEELTVEIYCRRYIAGEGREGPAMLQFAVNNGEAIEAEFHRLNEAARSEAAKARSPAKKRTRKPRSK